MQTTIKQVTPVEYDLEIRATADELAPDLNRVLRQQRTRTNLKGFRKGHVPLSVVKKLYGKALAYGVAEKSIQETYESSVLETEEHEVLGRPKITQLDYELDGDLYAVIRFGVRPEFELADTTGHTISRLTHEVTDEDVDEEFTRLREGKATHPIKEGPVEADDVVLVDLQLLDDSGLPVIGSREEGITYHLADERVKGPFRDSLIGRSADDEVVVSMPSEVPSEASSEEDGEDRRYQVTLKEVRAHVLPELDDAFVKEISDGRIETLDAFRDEVRKQLEDAWKTRSRELFESSIVEKMLELNEVDVPEAVADLYLDSFFEDFRRQTKERTGEELPDDFDQEDFRERYRDEAERQGRWMLIRDHVLEQNEIAVNDEDREAFFEKMAGEGNVDATFLKQYYDSVPGLADRLQQRLTSEKVFAFLGDQFEVVDKDRDALEAERKEKVEAEVKAREEAESIEVDAESKSWWRRPLDRVRNQLKKPR